MVAISAAMIMATSCTKDKFDEDNLQTIHGVERYVSAFASLPTMGGEDKAYLDTNDNGKVKWNTGDIININGTELTVTGAANSNTTAFFSGTVYAIPEGRDELYWAVYPSNLMPVTNSSAIPDKFGKGEIYFSYPSTQTYDATKNPLQNCAYMAGFAKVPQGTSNLRFEMKNLGAVLRINLQPKAGETNTKVSKLVFSSNKTLVGKCRIDNGEWGLAPQGENADDYTLVVNLTDGTHNYIDIAGGKTVYVLLCAPNGAQIDLTLKVYNTDDKYAQITSKNLELQRSSIYSSTIKDITFSKSELFSVAADRKVFFSLGNLQYQGSTGSWRFAPNQWDAVRNAAGNNAPSASQTAWMDLFGWGTSGYHDASDPYNTNYYPYSTSKSMVNATYNYYGYGPSINMTDPNLVGTSANYDWGVYNTIYNPKTGRYDPAGTWRTPTTNEWEYLFDNRTQGGNVNGISNPRYTQAAINTDGTTSYGIILFPDGYTAGTIAGVTWGTINDYSNYSTQCTSAGWAALESANCIFLPATGFRSETTVFAAGTYSVYWSSTYYDNQYANCVYFDGGDVQSSDMDHRNTGMCVRLVKDAH